MAVPFMRAYTRAARPDLPSPRRPRDRRHGARSSRTAASRRSPERRWPGCARTRSARRATGSMAPGSPIRTSCRVATRGLRRRPRRPARTRRSGCARSRRSTAADLLDVAVPGGRVTEAGVRANVSVGARSTSTPGCAATAPRRSTTSWRTLRRPRSAARSCGSGGPAGVALDDGRPSAPGRVYRAIRDEELERLGGPGRRPRSGRPRPSWTGSSSTTSRSS